jgi:hypothetical protein
MDEAALVLCELVLCAVEYEGFLPDEFHAVAEVDESLVEAAEALILILNLLQILHDAFLVPSPVEGQLFDFCLQLWLLH